MHVPTLRRTALTLAAVAVTGLLGAGGAEAVAQYQATGEVVDLARTPHLGTTGYTDGKPVEFASARDQVEQVTPPAARVLDAREADIEELLDIAAAAPRPTYDDERGLQEWALSRTGLQKSVYDLTSADYCADVRDDVWLPMLNGRADKACDQMHASTRDRQRDYTWLKMSAHFDNVCEDEFATYADDYPPGLRGTTPLRAVELLIPQDAASDDPAHAGRMRTILEDVAADVAETASRDACLASRPELASPLEWS